MRAARPILQGLSARSVSIAIPKTTILFLFISISAQAFKQNSDALMSNRTIPKTDISKLPPTVKDRLLLRFAFPRGATNIKSVQMQKLKTAMLMLA